MSKPYWNEEQDEALVKYKNPNTSQEEKKWLLEKYLANPLFKMVQSIVRKYPDYVGDCGYEELDYRAFFHVLERVHKYYRYVIKYKIIGYDDWKKSNNNIFKYDQYDDAVDAKLKMENNEIDVSDKILKSHQKQGYRNKDLEFDINYAKSFSYLQTIIRNYTKNHGRFAYLSESSQEDIFDHVEDLEKNNKFSYRIDEFKDEYNLKDLIHEFCNKLEHNLEKNYNFYDKNDILVGDAIIQIFKSWDTITEDLINNKKNNNYYYQKKIFQIIKDYTGLEKKDIKDSLSEFSEFYYLLKNNFDSNDNPVYGQSPTHS